MRKVFLVLLILLASYSYSQEVRRPSTEASPVGNYICGGTDPGGSGTVIWTNAHDAAGASTSQTNTLYGVYGGIETQEINGKMYSIPAASGSYSALVLKIDYSCSVLNAGGCSLAYSTNNGASWSGIGLIQDGNRHTTQATLSPSTDITQLQIRTCQSAPDGPSNPTRGRSTFTIYDTWTEGTLGAATTKKRPRVTTN